jgi:hypothetical protein
LQAELKRNVQKLGGMIAVHYNNSTTPTAVGNLKQLNAKNSRDASHIRDASHSSDVNNSRDATTVKTTAGPQQRHEC